MRYREITEAPLSDFAVYGDPDKEGSFAAQDVRAFTNPKWLTKVQSHFSRTPFRFAVYLYNAPEGKFYPFVQQDSSDPDKKTFTRNFQRYFSGRLNANQRQHLAQVLGVDIPRDRDAINIILTDNEGDEKFALTPWMLAHRVAHAVLQFQAGQFANETNYKIRQLIGAFSSILSAAKNVASPSEIFKFRSAREDIIARETEYYVELFTQYIVQGSITVKQPEIKGPEFIGDDNPINHAMITVLTKEAERARTTAWDDIMNRADTKKAMAAILSMSVEELNQHLDGELFLENWYELNGFAGRLNQLTKLNESVKTANGLVKDFLDECVGGTFILGAPREN